MTRRGFLVLGLLVVGLQCWGLYAPRPVDNSPDVPGLDKIVHLVMFAAPVWLLVKAGLNRLIVVAVFVVQAIFSEYAQGRWIAERGADVWDALADLAGIGLGVALARSHTARAGRDLPDRPSA